MRGLCCARTSAEFATQSIRSEAAQASYKRAEERAWKRCGGCWSKSYGCLGRASWLVGYLLWLAFWVLAPVILMAILAVRVAEYALGPEMVRAWVKRARSSSAPAAWRRTRRLLFALGVMPIRVLGWLMLYGLWHVAISLFWTPRMGPLAARLGSPLASGGPREKFRWC